MKLTRRDFTAGIVAGIAAPHVITSAKAQGATLKIGMCAPVTGPAAESGGYAIKGAKLALEAVNKAGGILGKQGELVIEDDQTTNPGIVLAFSKLAAQSDIVAFLGSIRSTQVHAMAPDVLKLAGPALYNTYGVADYAEESSDAAKAFGKAYRDVAKVAPDNQSSWTYDAVTVLSAAINKAGSTDPAKIREAILATKKFPGAEGEYNFDQNGDGLHGYNIVKNDKGNIVFDKHIEFND